MSEAARALWIKICGVTSVADAEFAVRLGADAIGLNFVPSSKRRVDEPSARRIADAVRGRAELVGVVRDLPRDELERLRGAVGLDALQLHGAETPEFLQALAGAFKAVAIGDAADVERAAPFGGERLLVDARANGESGGTGVAFDWSLVVELARTRKILLAGGLTPENVAEAVRRVRPFGVDVASGVERDGDARRKDPDRVERFIARARRA